MVDAIESSKYLSEAKTLKLIEALQRLCPETQVKDMKSQLVVFDRVKSMNTDIHESLGVISSAIAHNQQIRFKYFDYDVNKKRAYRKKGEFYQMSPYELVYQVSPWSMIYTDDNYYLLAYIDGDFKHFRVDKMDNVQAFILEEGDSEIVTLEREGREAFEKKDMSAYTKYTFSMYGDEPTPVTMVFQNRMVGVVMDRFGRDMLIMREDDRHFRITVPVAVSDQFFGWVFGLGKTVRIVGPEDVKAKMKKALADISARYED